MARRSPLLLAQPNAVSVCSKMLSAGETITVSERTLGKAERQLEKNGKITIRPSNKKGFVQVTCTLKG